MKHLTATKIQTQIQIASPKTKIKQNPHQLNPNYMTGFNKWRKVNNCKQINQKYDKPMQQTKLHLESNKTQQYNSNLINQKKYKLISQPNSI